QDRARGLSRCAGPHIEPPPRQGQCEGSCRWCLGRYRNGKTGLPYRRPVVAGDTGHRAPRANDRAGQLLRAAHHGRKEPAQRTVPAGPATRNFLRGISMNGLWVRGGAALTFACGASAGNPAGAAPIKSGARLASSTVVLRVDYTDFSKLFGDRVIASGESSFGVSKETQLALNVSSGRRRAGGNSIEATSVAGSIDHDWTDRLSSHTSIGLATNGSIFARRKFIQDFRYRFGGGCSATLGGKFADYGSNNRVTTWSAGAGYYFRGGSFSYRFSLLDSSR